MEAGEKVSVLARELGASRKGIYQPRYRYRLGRGNAWRSRCGRMTRAKVSADEGKPVAQEKPCKGGETNLTGGAGPGLRRLLTLV